METPGLAARGRAAGQVMLTGSPLICCTWQRRSGRRVVAGLGWPGLQAASVHRAATLAGWLARYVIHSCINQSSTGEGHAADRRCLMAAAGCKQPVAVRPQAALLCGMQLRARLAAPKGRPFRAGQQLPAKRGRPVQGVHVGMAGHDWMDGWAGATDARWQVHVKHAQRCLERARMVKAHWQAVILPLRHVYVASWSCMAHAPHHAMPCHAMPGPHQPANAPPPPPGRAAPHLLVLVLEVVQL